MSKNRLVIILLRIGIGTFFLYAATASFLYPYSWIDYAPLVLRSIFSEQLLLIMFSVYQLLLALWIFSGWKTFLAASLAAFTLLVMIAVDYAQMDLLFRNFAIFFAVGGLIAASYPDKR